MIKEPIKKTVKALESDAVKNSINKTKDTLTNIKNIVEKSKNSNLVPNIEAVNEVIEAPINEPIAPVEPAKELESFIPNNNEEFKEVVINTDIAESVNEFATPLVNASEVVEKKLSLFSSFKNKTEEDGKENKIEDIASQFLDKDFETNIESDDDSPEVRKALAIANGTGIVEIADLVMSVLCMFIAKDWSSGAREKYTMSKEKKKAIIICLVQIDMARKKKRNPVTSVVILVLTSCVPMIIMAVMARISKNREAETNLKIAQTNLARVKIEQTTQPVYTLPIRQSAPIFNVVKDKRGRHKKDCVALKGGVCDCK